jgi:hypothetical protein
MLARTSKPLKGMLKNNGGTKKDLKGIKKDVEGCQKGTLNALGRLSKNIKHVVKK